MFREETDEMQRVNEYRFYELGQRIKAIQGITGESEYSVVWYPLWEARNALVQLRADVVALRVSLPTVERVISAITEIVPMHLREAIDKGAQAEGSPPLTVGFDYYHLSEALKAFEPVLAAECNALDTYVVSQKRGYSTPDLVDRAEVMLPIETRSILNAGIIDDIKAAGRCLAFDVPTAAGFHILRAVEAVMAQYYLHLTGRELQKRNRNWAIYLKRLNQDVPTNDPKINGALDHIRENYRNPITHPEDTLTDGQSLMLFALSLSAIEMMAEVMRMTPPMLTEVEQMKALTEVAESKGTEPLDL